MAAILGTQQLSAETGIPVGTLRFWRHVGLGPVSFKLGRRVVYRRDEIDRWLADSEEATARGGAA